MDATQESPKPAKGKIVQMRGSVLSVSESFTNIAPIVDAALVDVDDSGQVRHALSLCQLLPVLMSI